MGEIVKGLQLGHGTGGDTMGRSGKRWRDCGEIEKRVEDLLGGQVKG